MAEAAEIETTDDMVTAGVELLAEWDSESYQGPLSSAREFVAALFTNMASASA